MSVQEVMARIAEIDRALTPAPVQAPSSSNFSAVLGAQTSAATPASATPAMAATGFTAAPAAAGGSPNVQAMLQAASAEVGQTEQPPGSNDSPRIAQYRSATAGSGVGPWCAYFASWAAAQGGMPLGEQGQGFGAVSAVYSWAQRTGRALPAGSTPQPGDLIVWGSRHIGIVESVDANGSIHTIEGNSSDAVSRRTYGADGGGATGYVRLS
jgi:hypothetical protein